jgi:hypothetical protein
MTKKEFLKKYNLTEDQFSGKEKVGGGLDLESLTSIPEGFNPTVGGYLDLRSLTSIPEGFNPTVGGDLDLRSLTSIPEGFNPTVGGYLYLESLTSIPEGFNPTVGGDLDLESLTSIPEGFNPTVGGGLDLRSLTSIPEGFNPTVGGYLYWKNNQRHIGANVPKVKKPILSWQDGKYTKIDGIFCEIISAHVKTLNDNQITIIRAKKINKEEYFFIARNVDFSAHGETIEKAISDLQFKIVAEKLKKEPINPDTEITVNHYRLITGACEFGVKNWMEQNGIKVESIKAVDLLPILKKTNAYGFDNFKKLITF